MRVYACRLTLHENLFYATREVGRLYETGRYLHNYALSYALGLAEAPYFNAEQVPRYASDLAPLNDRGIYVTPARGVEVAYALNTFKYADNHYHAEMVPGSRNTPSFGRAKEIAAGSAFEFAVLSERERLWLPRWVRLGLWRSKAAIVILAEVEASPVTNKTEAAAYPLNPLDVPGRLLAFDLISMPPSSLIDHALIEGPGWNFEVSGQRRWIPAGLRYTFPA
jgi:CRISPR-associated protein Csc1